MPLLIGSTMAFAQDQKSKQAGKSNPKAKNSNSPLLATKYLLEDYSKAAKALASADAALAQGKSPKSDDVNKALRDAAEAVCDGLKQLADDVQFWDALRKQTQDLSQNEAQIKQALDNLDQFLDEEDKILRPSMDAGARMRLISSLALAITRFRRYPTNAKVDDLQKLVKDARDATCDRVAKMPPGWSWFSLVTDGLDVVGGGLAIAANIATGPALILMLASIVGGIAGILHGSNGAIQKLKPQ